MNSAKYILANSTILIPENCIIVNDVLYEKLLNHPEGETYRMFFSTDDYDYVDPSDSIILYLDDHTTP